MTDRGHWLLWSTQHRDQVEGVGVRESWATNTTSLSLTFLVCNMGEWKRLPLGVGGGFRYSVWGIVNAHDIVAKEQC